MTRQAGAFAAVVQAVFGQMKRLEVGLTSLFAGNMVYFNMRHRLVSVVSPKAAAVLVLRGQKGVTIGDETRILPAGEMIMLPPLVECTIENIPDTATGQYLALCLPFHDAMLARAGAGQCRDGTRKAPALADFTVQVDTLLLRAVQVLMELPPLCPEESRLQELYLEALLLLIAGRTPCLPWLWGRSQSYGARCTTLVSLDPGRKWTSTDLAGKLAVSERSLRRVLQVEGTSIRRILQDARLNASLGLLQMRAGSVAEVAARCGYDSPSRFSGLFRQRFGVSPADVLRFNAVLG